MISEINVRFFILAINVDNDDELEIYEITESCFLEYKDISEVEYKRHSIFENGCRQVCLTLDPQDCPVNLDLELI